MSVRYRAPMAAWVRGLVHGEIAGQVLGGEGGPGGEAGKRAQKPFQGSWIGWAWRLEGDLTGPEPHEHQLFSIEHHPGQAPPLLLLRQRREVAAKLGNGLPTGARLGKDSRALELHDKAVEHGVGNLPFGDHVLVADLRGHPDLGTKLPQDRLHRMPEGGLVWALGDEIAKHGEKLLGKRGNDPIHFAPHRKSIAEE